jgi:hypothetical protein
MEKIKQERAAKMYVRNPEDTRTHITDLISSLQEIVAEYGDLPVEVWTNEIGYSEWEIMPHARVNVSLPDRDGHQERTVRIE